VCVRERWWNARTVVFKKQAKLQFSFLGEVGMVRLRKRGEGI
jgi:hypothetical protein